MTSSHRLLPSTSHRESIPSRTLRANQRVPLDEFALTFADHSVAVRPQQLVDGRPTEAPRSVAPPGPRCASERTLRDFSAGDSGRLGSACSPIAGQTSRSARGIPYVCDLQPRDRSGGARFGIGRADERPSRLRAATRRCVVTRRVRPHSLHSAVGRLPRGGYRDGRVDVRLRRARDRSSRYRRTGRAARRSASSGRTPIRDCDA